MSSAVKAQGNEFRLTDFAGGGHVGRSWVQSDGGSPQWLHDFVSKPLLFRPGTYFRSATGSVPTKSVNLNSLPWMGSQGNEFRLTDFAGGGHVGRSWVQSDGGSPQWLH